MSYSPVSNTTAWLSTGLNSSIKLLLQIEQMFQSDPSVWNNSIGSEQGKRPPEVPLLLQQCRPVDDIATVTVSHCCCILFCLPVNACDHLIRRCSHLQRAPVLGRFWKQEGRIDTHTLTWSTHSQQLANSSVRSNILNVGPFRFSYHRNLVPVWAQIQ